MTLTIRERKGNHWATTNLTPALLTRNVRSTMVHGQTGQEISDGWLDMGTTVYVHPRDVGHQDDGHPFATLDELPNAKDTVYDELGMRYRIRHADWDAVQIRQPEANR